MATLFARTKICYRNESKKFKITYDSIIQTSNQHHYLTKLLGYNYTIIYKPGRATIGAGALSRNDSLGDYLSILL